MGSSKVIDEKIIRVSDILEQIDEINKMVEIHKGEKENNSMLAQYEFMRDQFVKELDSILKEFQIEIKAA